MTGALITWAACATLLYAFSEIWRAGERRQRERAERQLFDARTDILRVQRILDIAADSQSVKIKRDESGEYHVYVVPRAEVREVTLTMTVNAPDGAA